MAEARRKVLAPCVGLFDTVAESVAPDGFPRLVGILKGRRVRVSLIPDTLTVKRLPQLWLALSMPGALVVPRLVVTSRPRGDDFVSAGTGMRHHLDVPDWLPVDCSARGDDGEAAPLLLRLRKVLAGAFVDPYLKEISLGPKGLRLLYRAAEGHRGSHLLLRQARFDAPLEGATLLRLQAILRDIEESAGCSGYREAA